MPVTNRRGGNNGLGKALILTSLPAAAFLNPWLGAGVAVTGIIVNVHERLKDQNQKPESENELLGKEIETPGMQER